MKEILVYGIPAGETERYTESLLATKCKDAADVAKVKEAAGRDGFHSFRVAEFDTEAKPDFSKIFAKGGR